jgi:hypothetical protein
LCRAGRDDLDISEQTIYTWRRQELIDTMVSCPARPAVTVLRALARGIRALETDALGHEHTIRTIVRAWTCPTDKVSARSTP